MTTILIIDDDRDLRAMMRRVLEGDGYTVHEAENGVVGIDLIDAVRPDLVFLDVSMPMMSGPQVLAELAHRPNARAFRIVAMSGRRGSVSPTQCFLLKPISATLLTAVVRDFCGAASRSPAQTKQTARQI